jgi:hypothetical protein
MYPIQSSKKPSTQTTAIAHKAFIPLKALVVENKLNSSKTLEESGITPTVANKQNWINVVVSNVHSNDFFREHIEGISSEAKKINIIVHERDGDYQIAFKGEKTAYFETNDSVRLLGFDPETNHSRAAAQELLKSVMTNRDISIATSRKVASNLGPECVAALDEGLVHILPGTRKGCYQLVVKISSSMGNARRHELLKPFYYDNNFYVESHSGPVFIGINKTVDLMGNNHTDMDSYNEAQDTLRKMAEYSHYSQSQSG